MLHLFQHCQQPLDGLRQGLGRLVNLVVVERLLLLHTLQNLLSLAQISLHLLQLPGQGLVGLFQLCFSLCFFIWNESKKTKLRWSNRMKVNQLLNNVGINGQVVSTNTGLQII